MKQIDNKYKIAISYLYKIEPFTVSGCLAVITLLLVKSSSCLAQSPFEGLEPLFTEPKRYVAYYIEDAPVVDGDIGEAEWELAEWSDYFVDIEGDSKPNPAFETRVKMLWSDSCLFIAAQMEEPHVWATLKQHDAVIFYDNDFEVFIDPENTTHQYYEIEVNAFNTLFDLYMPKPYRNNSDALITWHVDSFRSAVKIQGTLNDPKDVDIGWMLEMAIPFRSVSMGNKPKVPTEGSFWRINFSRVEWETEVIEGEYIKRKDEKGKPLQEHNWVWSPQGVINMHYPERWGYLQFMRIKNDSLEKTPDLPYAEKQKRYLWLIYYKQKEFYQQHSKYADSFEKIGLAELIQESTFLLEDGLNKVEMEAGRYQFLAVIQGPDQLRWSINQEGLIQLLNK